MSNNKIGLEFYGLDTNRYQDIRIKRLKKDFSCNGIAVYDYILCEIYRVKGCFIVWDDSTVFDVADYFAIKESLVREIVNYCGVVGLFDKELLTRGNIITSHSIQTRYVETCIRMRRKNITVPDQIKLVEVSELIAPIAVKTTQNVGSLAQNDVSLPTTRVKYTKEKKSKEEVPPTNPIFEKVKNSFKIPIDQCKKLFIEDEMHCHRITKLLNISQGELMYWINAYFNEQEIKGVEENSLMEVKSHFGSWLPIKLGKQNGGKEKQPEYFDA